MKIKTKLNLSILITAMLVSVLIAAQIIGYNHVSKEIENLRSITEIQQSALELNILMNEYLSEHHTEYQASSERIKQQWNLRYDSGLAFFQKIEESEKREEENTLINILSEKEEEEERALIRGIKGSYAAFGGVFSQLIQTHEKKDKLIEEGASQKEIDAVEKLENLQLSLAQIFSQEIASSTTALRDVVFEHFNEQNKSINAIMVLLIALIFIITAAISFKVSRDVKMPLSYLTKNAELISRGELGHRIVAMNDDEFGELITVFNKMTADLSKSRKLSDDYKKTLEKIVAKRTKALQEKIEEQKKFNSVAVGRELKMIELKNRMSELESLAHANQDKHEEQGIKMRANQREIKQKKQGHNKIR
ncbi:MAG: hypothetical protein Q8O89_05865 [Nanoarchaeota archaeon]|nr:hypothetical protein [Nanoarchaeota archaeon]